MNYRLADEYITQVLKDKREQLGYSMQDIADEVGISKGAYKFYESNKRSMPFDVYKKICDVLKINYIKLFKESQKRMFEELEKEV